jgi:hypothetical protein
LITTDECNLYPEVLLEQYGETVAAPCSRPGGRRRKPVKAWPKGAVYGTVKKTYAKGRVTAVTRRLVHGTEADLKRALEASPASREINTAFVERQNGTDRTYNARKARKTCEFSKDLLLHVAVSWWVLFCYNFHHLHRSLRQTISPGCFLHRTPAMALGLAHRPLSVADILGLQVVGFIPSASPTVADFGLRQSSGPAP